MHWVRSGLRRYADNCEWCSELQIPHMSGMSKKVWESFEKINEVNRKRGIGNEYIFLIFGIIIVVVGVIIAIFGGVKRDGVMYYAEYYDGMQAPFTVCKWCNDFQILEELLKILLIFYIIYINNIVSQTPKLKA